MALSGNLGFVLGPALAGLLGATIYGEILPVVAALLISLLATIIIGFGLEESDPCVLTRLPEPRSIRKVFGQEHRDCFEIKDKGEQSFRSTLRMDQVPALLVVYFLVMLSFSFFYIGFPVHAVRELSWTVTETGIFFAYLSLLMVLVQGPILASAAKKYSERVLVMLGTVVLAAGFCGLFFDSRWIIYLAASLIALGNGLMWPSVMALLSTIAGTRHQGAVQGAGGSVGAVASIVGLIAGGLIYTWLSGGIFVLAALVVIPVALITRGMRPPNSV
jgi:MFS family permease